MDRSSLWKPRCSHKTRITKRSSSFVFFDNIPQHNHVCRSHSNPTLCYSHCPSDGFGSNPKEQTRPCKFGCKKVNYHRRLSVAHHKSALRSVLAWSTIFTTAVERNMVEATFHQFLNRIFSFFHPSFLCHHRMSTSTRSKRVGSRMLRLIL